jgi:hypothetical protein
MYGKLAILSVGMIKLMQVKYLVEVVQGVGGEDEDAPDGLGHGYGLEAVEGEDLLGPDEGADALLHVQRDHVQAARVLAHGDATERK